MQLRLLILALVAAAALAQPLSFNVKSFGAAGDGVTLETKALNAAVAAASAAGGGTVVLPAGTYLSGTVRLRTNVTLWLEAGAVLRGTKDLAQYETAVDGQDWYHALVLAKGVSNVAIAGRGLIDGNQVRNPRGEERMRGPHAVLLYETRDVSIRDFFIRDAGNYNVTVRSSEHLTIDGITARGGWDGFNMHDTRGVTISNCHLYTGDDSLAGANWENVTVSNCILNSSANAIRVGGRNVIMNGLVIFGPGEYPAGTSQRHNLEAGFQILPNRGYPAGSRQKHVVEPGPIDNMVISNVTIINAGSPIYIAYSADAPYSANNLGVGRIVFNNVTVTGGGLTPVYISAPPDNPAKSIVLNNVRIRTVGGVSEDAARQQGFSPFSVMPAYGIYARNVENLELNDVRLEYDKPDLRSVLISDNVGHLELQHFHAAHADHGAPSIQISGDSRITIDGHPAPQAKAREVARDTNTGNNQGPLHASITVQNTGAPGMAPVTLDVAGEKLSRQVWLNEGETARIAFLNLIPKPKEATRGAPIAPPYLQFTNTTGEARRDGDSFYLRAAGDYPLQQFGDQYLSVYQVRSLAEHASVIAKLENPDLRTNWAGRAGIIVRTDITKPDHAAGYVILATSPAAGISLEWDSNADGRLDQHTNFDGNTLWPVWLKLERDGQRFTGYRSQDGEHWIKVGECSPPGTTPMLDAGIFTYRDSARFDDFRILPENR